MLAKQTALALERMEAAVFAMAQEAGIDPPQGLGKRHRDADVARRDLLTSLADWLEAYHASVSTVAEEVTPEIEEEDTTGNPVSKKRKR